MQDWLPLIAALAGVLATVSAWSYLSQRRLAVRAAELERALDVRTTELESARIQLQRLSTQDPLTEVANHEQFLEIVDREWRRSRRERLPLTVIFVDVDHFRAFNREFGREEGDRVLKSVSRALTTVVGRAETWWRAITVTSSGWCWRQRTVRARPGWPNSSANALRNYSCRRRRTRHRP